MRKLLVLVVLAVAFSAVASADPILCTDASLTNLQALINQSQAGGCYVQDKLFTNWSYSGTTAATNVGFNVIFSAAIPGIDVHGFSFTPKDDVGLPSIWTADFSLGYTISVIQPSVMTIIGVTDQMMLGPTANSSTTSWTHSNGYNFNLSQGGSTTGSSLFPGVTSVDSLAVVTIPGGTGSYVVSLEEDFTQISTPEPMTFVLIGTGLVGLGLIRRRVRKS
jgi:hypothetical protein